MADEVPPLIQLQAAGKLAETGSCWNCGFLCHKDELNRHLSSYVELTPHNREWGRFFPLLEVWAPWCFRYEPVLQEIGEKLGHEPRVIPQDQRLQAAENAAAMDVVTKVRGCAKWTKYKPGLGPKDHSDEQFMQHLEEQNRANDLKIAELDQRSQESMLEIMKANKEVTDKLATIATDQVVASDRQERSNRRFNRLFVAIGLIAIVLALMPLAYPNGINQLVKRAPGARGNSAQITPVLPSPSAVALSPTPSLESAPGTASSLTPTAP